MITRTALQWTLAVVLCTACGELDAGPIVEAPTDGRAADAMGAAADQWPGASLDASAGVDAANLDAANLDAANLDAANLDAAAPFDAEVDAEVDAAPILDMAVAPDLGWGPCAVNGAPGDCLPVDDCAPPSMPVAGFCPGPAGIQCCVAEPDAPPVQGCDPNAYPQPNAGLEEAPGEAGCPAGMIVSGAVCIDRHEASLVLPDGAPWSPYHHPGQRAVIAVSVAGAVPQGYIDGVTAERACVAAGKRLCTNAEWLRACQGAAGDTYPYGDARRAGVCNDARARHPAVELFPDDPSPFDRIQHPCINQLADGLAPTGAHPECVTAGGAFDMMGNLHEWTADPDGTFRGGFYVDTVRNGPGCLYRTTAHNRQHWDYSTGFRCCADR